MHAGRVGEGRVGYGRVLQDLRKLGVVFHETLLCLPILMLLILMFTFPSARHYMPRGALLLDTQV